MAKQTPPKEKLVGDLETLVTLLEEGIDPTLDLFADEPSVANDAQAAASAETAQHTELPAAPPSAPNVDAPEPAPAPAPAQNQDQDPDLFQALLGSGWQAQSNELLQAASASIQAQKLDWNPEDTEALTAALRVRLEQSINGWLSTTLAEQVELLREQLLFDLQDELAEQVQSTLHGNQQQRAQKEDGLSQLAADPAAPSGTDR